MHVSTCYQLTTPATIFSGIGSLKALEEIVKNYQKIAIFTDKGIVKAGVLNAPLVQIEQAKVPYEILSQIPAEPTYQEAQQVVNDFFHTQADCIVAVGGGSVMDIAKLASVLEHGATVKNLLDQPSLAKKHIPTIMIPTTAGTGSEATPNSIVGVPEEELKVGIVSTEMIADYVILDGTVLANLPQPIAASTGIDALAHAVECFTSKKATPFSNMYALEALKLILNNILIAYGDSKNLEAKQEMLLASFYAGVAITASGTTAVHALSYPLGGKYHIPHGVANAIMLLPVMRFNEPLCRKKFAEIYDRVHVNDISKSIEEKSAWFIRQLKTIVRELKIPTTLSPYNVSKNDIDILVESGMKVTRLLVNNMREVSAKDARKLYVEIL